jgi:tRNA threonylcarbamoyladenosine biosynthesis protein TsaE
MKFSARVENELQLPEVAHALLGVFPDARVFAFTAEMGTGKTTFIKQLCLSLGVTDAMSSPTFSIVNEYRSQSGSSIYHFDFYRLKSAEEAFDAGLHEYLHSGSYCFVEWPELAPEILPPDSISVTITLDGSARIFTADHA